MSAVDADTNSTSNDGYGQYDDLEAALVIAAADADARNHVVRSEEEQEEDGKEVKQQESEESLGYYQNNVAKTEVKEPEQRKTFKRQLSDDEDYSGIYFFYCLM